VAKNNLLCKTLLCVMMLITSSCHSDRQAISHSQPAADKASHIDQNLSASSVHWTTIKSEIVNAINSDLKTGLPTVNIGVYYPSNLDESFVEKFSVDEFINELIAAKDIFGVAGVQLNLLWIKSGEVDRQYLSLQSNDLTNATPGSQYVNMYEDMNRRNSSLSRDALAAFNSIIEHHEENHRTVYLVVLQHVFMSFFEQVDERTWETKTITTGGLSFPSYIHVNNMPKRLRGAITITRNDALDKIIAHELGHKLLNVSHEYREMNPQHEIRAEGGLMVYGSGTEILSGEQGRWHKERLHLSPYVYRQADDGSRIWNADYTEGGHYYDRVCGDKVVGFSVAPAADD
jgi:hypothetical protein